MKVLVLCIIIIAHKSFGTNELEEQCNALTTTNKIFAFGNCFVAGVDSSRTRAQAVITCNHFPNGHLAFVPNSAVRETILSMKTLTWWIGLRKIDNTGGAKENWLWIDGNGHTYPEPYTPDLWNSGPNAAGISSYATLSISGFGERYSHHIHWPLCQYTGERKHYKLISRGKRAADAAILLNTTMTQPEGAMKCAKKCRESPICFGFSVHETSRLCLTQRDNGKCPEYPLINDIGYDMYGVL